MAFDRRSGVFAHVTQLPGPHGIGDLGAGARRFLDFLDRADQSLWQFCPLGPTSAAHGHSPYAADSAFAGNPLLVDLVDLAERGWLADDAAASPEWTDPHAVDYDRVAAFKRERLHEAFEGFEAEATDEEREVFAAFRERESAWLADYALFEALKTAHDGAAWTAWPDDLAGRDDDALAAAREEHAEAVRYHAFVQWTFDRQWDALREAAAERGIDLVGDLPIYVAADSADVWASPEAFQLREDREPAVVAGVPPSGDGGQRWGNPLYDWEHLRETGYEWWIQRLERLLSQVDVARLDHFKGFDAYWAIPADADDPAAGEWRPGPGAEFFETVRERLGDLPFVVENLGFLDEGVADLRTRFDFPGMRVPQYADWCADVDRYKPAAYPENAVAYTSTHDTDTATGYYADLSDEQRDCLHYALATDAENFVWDLVEAVFDSNANLAFTTLPDLLELGSEARFNTPGTAEGNWRWRVTDAGLDESIADRLAGITIATLR